jgi:hypothetical protein
VHPILLTLEQILSGGITNIMKIMIIVNLLQIVGLFKSNIVLKLINFEENGFWFSKVLKQWLQLKLGGKRPLHAWGALCCPLN